MAKTKGYPEALEKKLHEQRYFRDDSNPEFTKNVKAISRTIAHMCYQCGTCTGLMPVCTPQHLPYPQVYAKGSTWA